ncbi:hypothetical protein LC607_24980 [Nostoc sp. CHAB 5824]|nr:hypothetical protein [Nostoc sp. CHAB 5824]
MANSLFNFLNVSDLNGTNGFIINAIAEYDASGNSVSNAGDINNDGIDDLIIGASNASPNGNSRAGQSYVVFGGRNLGSSGSLNPSDLNGTNGFLINGIAAGDSSGTSVSNGGDINGDDIDDLIIGAASADRNGKDFVGQSYVVFGGKNLGSSGSLNLSDLNGTNGFLINGIAEFDYSGGSVSNAGDINGDGIDDLIIGAPGGNPNGNSDAGQSYVVFGGRNLGSGGTLNPSDLNGTNGFIVNGIAAGDSSGFSVSNGGDINGDGIDDLIIGAANASRNGKEFVGQSYVVFGGRNLGSGGTLNPSDLNGTNGFLFNGSGGSVSNRGDINGDGIDDLIIGASNADPNGIDNAGQSYVVFGGRNLGSGGSLNPSDLNGTNGFLFNGIAAGESSGASVSNAGDINGDGIDDLIIGAPGVSRGANLVGQSYVVFGGRNLGSGGTFNLSDLNGTNGFIIKGIAVNDYSGISVSNGGDINGDGIDDLIIGAYRGQSYVVFGGRNLGSGDTPGKQTGTPGADTFFGTPSNNIDGLNANDTLTGNGGQDKFVFHSSDRNDIITDFGGVGEGSNPSSAVIANVDTLQFTDSGLTAKNLQLTQKGNNLEVTFENVASTKVTLQNFLLENLDNLPETDSTPAIGNIQFDKQTSITDSFDVINANSTQTSIFNKNTVTFLNELDNNIAGFDNSDDVINGQGGNDIINGLSGNDLLRGRSGDDILIGGEGNNTLVDGKDNDILVGGLGADRFLYNTDAAFALTAIGVDAITDFNSSQGDQIILDKTTFSAITSAAGTGFNNLSDFEVTNLTGTSTAKIVYNPVSGQLFYNPNGNAAGFGSGGLFATLTGAPTLTVSDFVLQA